MAKGFFNDFATGFFNAGADIYSERRKQQEQLDKIRAEKLASVEAEKELYKWKQQQDTVAQREKLDNLRKAMGIGAINQTPDAVVNAPKPINPALAPVPTGTSSTDTAVDDNAQPFPASEPIQVADAGNMSVPSAVTPPAPQAPAPAPAQPLAPILTGNDLNVEKQAELAMAAHIAKYPDDDAGAMLAYQNVKDEARTKSPAYRAELAKLEKKSQVEGEMLAKNAVIEPLKAEAKAFKERGIPSPTESGYFNKSPELRDKMDLEDSKFLNDWQSGGSELGKKYINAKTGQAVLSAAAQLQPDVETGGLLWGSATLNDLRTRFDPEADAFKAIVSKLSIEQAKQVYPVSNTDMTFIQRLSQSLEGTEEGNLAKIQIAATANQAVLDQFNFFSAYKLKWGTLDGAGAAFEKYMNLNPLLDAKKSSGLEFVSNANRQPIDDFINGKKPVTQAETKGKQEPSKALPIPTVGTVEDGYRFKGGNPADQNNWEKVQ